MFTVRLELEGESRSFKLDLLRMQNGTPAMQDVSRRASDLSVIAPAILKILTDQEKEVRDTQGAALNAPWRAYTAEEWKRYVPWKFKKLGEARELRWASGKERLWPSLTVPGHQNQIFNVTKDSFEFGTTAPGALNHQTGTGRAQKWMGGYQIPKRTILGVNKRAFNLVRRTVQRYVRSGESSGYGIEATGGVVGAE